PRSGAVTSIVVALLDSHRRVVASSEIAARSRRAGAALGSPRDFLTQTFRILMPKPEPSCGETSSQPATK
ncbi:MAG: hypothetical protein AAF236_14425, partial [Verrucomicrobiota bacterium]